MEVEPAPVQLPAAADPMAPGPVDAAVQGGAQPPAPGGNPVVPQNPALGGGPGGAVAPAEAVQPAPAGQAEAVQPVQPAAPPAPVAAVAPAGPAPFDHQALVQMQLQLMQQMQQQQAAFMQVIPALIPRAPAAEPQKPRGNPAKGTLAPFTEKEDPERFFERFEIFMSYERTLTPRDALLFACRDYAAAESYALALPSDISLIALKASFLGRWSTEVLSRKERARDALVGRSILMDEVKGVREYSQRFQEKARDAGYQPGIVEMDDFTLIPLFQNGLTPALKSECVVDAEQKPFRSLTALISWASGRERALRALAKPSSKPTLAYAERTPRPRVKQTGNKRRNLLPAVDGGAHEPPFKRVQTRNAQGRGSNPLGLTKIRGPDGRLLSHLEWGMFKAKGLCLTCGQAGHRAAECPNKENKPPKK
ncbi:hypothetical protein HYH03_001627 [Edaphochlamys debaryana]|uniref:CCHC-type domain-containing protein n=1 Tax=Edaphochlamys debaryana TaxID=47281 RepID=A0A835YE18_9CHLO|nr:hypothetical protein HYH03_001627 [Edaphochlamys debaryana]|eukprot:KAG2500866.1 hypothetical protein HYH03_001627 [Edaphochlamys debaryana]